MILDYKDINDLDRYKIMSGSIVPRPIAWIVTDDDGVLNVAPFSYFYSYFYKSCISNCCYWKKDDGTLKDTLANILKTKSDNLFSK